MTYIRIIGVPAGEAPLAIRQAWVGCILPLAKGQEARPSRHLSQGVISSANKTLLARLFAPAEVAQGYSVFVLEAMTVLAQHNPYAAQWWHENTPHLTKLNQAFVFEASACQVLDENGYNA